MSRIIDKTLPGQNRIAIDEGLTGIPVHTHTADATVVATVTANTTSLEYKDHSGVNQTMDVVTSISVTYDTVVDESGGAT